MEGWLVAKQLTEDLIALMKKAGLVRISFGIESGNPDVLKVVGKGVTMDEIRSAYKITKKYAIETRGSAILGLRRIRRSRPGIP